MFVEWASGKRDRRKECEDEIMFITVSRRNLVFVVI